MSCFEERGRTQGSERFEEAGSASACEGVKLIKEGAHDISTGIKSLEAAKKATCKAINETEEVLKLLRLSLSEIEKTEKLDYKGLKAINRGVVVVEEDLRRHRICCNA